MTSLYKPNIPTGTVNLDVDYQNIQNNFSQLDTSFGVDHVPFSDASNNGYHGVIHQPPESATPANIASIGQLFTKLYTPDTTVTTADTQLYFLTGANGLSQLTGGFATSDGWQWIGGVLVQWGIVTQSFLATKTSGQVTFKDRVVGAIPFPNACFTVYTIPTYVTAAIPGGGATVAINSQTLISHAGTKFDWTFNSNSSGYEGFYWFAVGY